MSDNYFEPTTSSVCPSTMNYAYNYMNYMNNYDMYDIGNMYSPAGSIFSMPGFMPMYGNPQQMDEYYRQLNLQQEKNNEYSIKQQEMNRTLTAKTNAPEQRIQQAAQNLKDKICTNEQKQILEAYKSLVDTVKSTYPDLSEAESIAYAKNKYAELNQDHKTIIQDLRDYSDNSFWGGFQNGWSFGWIDATPAEKNIADIQNSEVGRGDRFNRFLGQVSGATVTGATGIGLGYGIIKVGKWLASGKAGKWGKYLGGAIALAGAAFGIAKARES